MKNIINLVFFIVPLFSICAQVGINTSAPLGVFHIDGRGDNSNTPTLSEVINDVVVTEDGYVGIGTASPTVKLEINTGGTSTNPIIGFRLKDGSENAGDFLISDVNGVGFWDAANNLRLEWNTNRKFTIPYDGMYLVSMYLDDNNTTGVFTNVWANPTLTITTYNRIDLYSETRGQILISNINTQGNYGVSLSGIIYMEKDEVVVAANLGWSSVVKPVLGVEIIPM